MEPAPASLQRFIRESPVAVAMFDREMRYLAASRGWIEDYGLAGRDLSGLSHYEVFPEIPQRWKDVHQRALAGETIRREEDQFLRANGEVQWLRWEVRPWHEPAGAIAGLVIYSEDITARRRTREALEESEERLRLLGDNLPDSAVYQYTLEPGGTPRFLYMSAGVERMTGVKAEEVRRDPWALHRRVPSPYREQLEEAEAQSARDLVEFDMQVPLIRPDGKRRWIRLHSRPRRQPDGRVIWDGVQTDITGQIQVHEDLRRSLDTLRAILEAAPTGIVVSDVEGRVILASAAAERLSRGLLTPGASLPDLSHTLFTPDGMPVPPERQPLARALKGEEVSDVELQFRGKDGRESITTVYATPLRGPDGAIWAAVTVFLDITRRKHAEKAVQEADRRKDEFLAILSHELRNPLAAIRYALPLLARQTAPEAKERAVGVIDRQATHLARLVDDLLDISRITSDKIELRRERVPLASIVAAAVEAAAPAVAAGRHDLRTSLGEEEIWVDADPARLAQVITNLLANSAKCTPRPGEIVLEAVREAGQAVVRVRDTGVGLSPEALATVFDMFRQVPHLNKASGGLGVGLALARRLVEMHGGTLEARSEGEGRGAEFTIRIPVAEPVKAAADTGRPAAPAASRRLKVLVVDDNADLLEMLSLFVEIAGHEVRKALDGRSALAAAAAFRPDVVLLDLGLPVMNGLEVAREMRRRAETAGARLVALTGWGQARDRAETRAAGFDRHLTKPTDAETLEALLAEYARE